jgi:DNA-binding CsgD family transcriptional regulator
MLCAYTIMELSTKEIAQLLNISVRGVETMRYRLKKKIIDDKNIDFGVFLKEIAKG